MYHLYQQPALARAREEPPIKKISLKMTQDLRSCNPVNFVQNKIPNIPEQKWKINIQKTSQDYIKVYNLDTLMWKHAELLLKLIVV